MANKGYECIAGDCNNLVLGAVTGLDAQVTLVGENQKPSYADIQAGLIAGDTIYIGELHKYAH